MRRLLTTALAFSFPLILLAQAPPVGAPAGASVQVPATGSWGVWTRSKAEPGRIQLKEEPKGVVAVSGEVAGLWNKDTNRAAEKPLAELPKGKPWAPGSKEFTRIAVARVVVSHQGDPVSSGVVTLKAGSESREALLTPEDKGELIFQNLPSGPLTVTVSYKSEGGDKKTAPVTTTPGAEGAVALAVEVPEKVGTVAEEKPASAPDPNGDGGAKEGAKKEEAPAPGQSPLTVILNFVIGLAILGALGFGVYKYFQKDPKQVADLLKKAGLDPDGKDQDTPPAQAVTVKAPLQTIVLDDAAPAPAAGPVVMGTAPAAGGFKPRLALEDGFVLDLTEGLTAVGRDPGMALSFGADKGVSRSHAVLRRTGDQVVVEDLGSTNGTYVNGVKITGETVLRPGDLVIFGAARCRYEA